MGSVLLDVAVKGAIVLALTGLVATSMRSSSAAMRHLVWSIGMLAVVVLPVLAGLLPDWGVSILPAESAPVLHGAGPDRVGGTGSTSGWVILWAAGTLLVLVVFLVGRIRVRWLARDAIVLDHGPWSALATRLAGEMDLTRPVRLLQSRRPVMPLMWGVFRPTILLPREADGWSEALKRDVILHELAHVQRHDYLSQMIARLGCALHWFDPLAWLAVRRLRIERERACDDRVIQTGSSPCDYATHLLAVARWRVTGAVVAPALQMAGGSPLADRLEAVLQAGRRRTGITRRVAAAHGALAALLVVPLATLRPEASPAPPGGILTLPPSVTARAGERAPTEEVERTRENVPETAATSGAPAKPSAEQASTAPAPATHASPAHEVEVSDGSPLPVVRIAYRTSSSGTAVSVEAVDTRLLTRVAVAKDAYTETCSESKEHESQDETPATRHRTTLVSAPRLIDTP